jgi:hypothetical protein
LEKNFLSYEKIGGKTTFFSHVFVIKRRGKNAQASLSSSKSDTLLALVTTTPTGTIHNALFNALKLLSTSSSILELFICACFSLFNALFRAPRKEEDGD